MRIRELNTVRYCEKVWDLDFRWILNTIFSGLHTCILQNKNNHLLHAHLSHCSLLKSFWNISEHTIIILVITIILIIITTTIFINTMTILIFTTTIIINLIIITCMLKPTQLPSTTGSHIYCAAGNKVSPRILQKAKCLENKISIKSRYSATIFLSSVPRANVSMQESARGVEK